jgi:hypothetical protein
MLTLTTTTSTTSTTITTIDLARTRNTCHSTKLA